MELNWWIGSTRILIKNMVRKRGASDAFHASFLAEIKLGTMSKGVIHIVNPGENIWDVVQAAQKDGKKSIHAVDLRFKNLSEIHTRACWIDISKGRNAKSPSPHAVKSCPLLF